MSDAYHECMVAGKTPGYMIFLKFFLILMIVFTGFLGLTIMPLMIFVAAGLGVGLYFVILHSDIEYEYLYLDKEITVDKVMHKSRRKRIGVYSVDKIEIMAPMNSWHLDSYKNRTFKIVDLSSGIIDQPDRRYTFYYDGTEQVIIEPDDTFVKMVRNIAPRKIFND